MPDVDRFERTLRGPYWRKAYRLSFADQNSEALRNNLTKACAAYLREAFPRDCLKRCPQIILDLLRRKSLEPGTGHSVFLDLNHQLKQMDSEQRNFAAIEIMKIVVQTVYTDLEPACKSVTPLNVQRSFSKELIKRIIRHCFLARVRDGIASQRNQSASQQLDWEERLIADVSAKAEGMLKSFFKRDGVIRAPKQSTRRRMTLDELNAGLPVSEV